jgi:hypothetical protein
MNLYKLSLPVPGGWGEGTQVDTTVWPPKISVLEMDIDGWDGDGLLDCFPIFMVTGDLEARLRAADLTGWSVRPMVARTTDTFDAFYPGVQLPELLWLEVRGAMGVDDFALTAGHELVVSERALEFVGDSLPTAEYMPFVPGVTPE